MTNHFHLLLRPEPGVAIGRAMQSLLVAHTGRYHRRRKTLGHVWQGRFKSPPVQDDAHLWTVLRYIEANPARAGMVADLADYPWSSYPAHALGRPDPLLSELPEWDHLGITPAGRSRAWRAKVRAALPEADLGAIRTSLKTGRAFGDEAWCERQATRHGLSAVPRPRGRPKKVVPSIGQENEPGRIG